MLRGGVAIATPSFCTRARQYFSVKGEREKDGSNPLTPSPFTFYQTQMKMKRAIRDVLGASVANVSV